MKKHTPKQAAVLDRIDERRKQHLVTYYQGTRTEDSLVRRGDCVLTFGGVPIIARTECD